MASSRSNKTPDLYAEISNSISEALKQFDEFSAAINEVCKQSSLFGRSLQSLEDLTLPEVIGGEQVNFKVKKPSQKFTSGAHLSDSLVTYSKIMMSFSEKLKSETIDTFENFIIQVVTPNQDEIRAIHEHNSKIVAEFRECFFSLYNHFFVLGAELLEKFLVCHNCSSLIGFPHKPLCLTKSLATPNVWKKTKYDDKFITFGMKFSFHEILAPGDRKNILTKIASTCLKQTVGQNREKPFLTLNSKNWPKSWVRDEKEKKKKRPQKQMRKVYSAPIESEMMSVDEKSIWKPTGSDNQLLVTHFKKSNGKDFK